MTADLDVRCEALEVAKRLGWKGGISEPLADFLEERGEDSHALFIRTGMESLLNGESVTKEFAAVFIDDVIRGWRHKLEKVVQGNVSHSQKTL